MSGVQCVQNQNKKKPKKLILEAAAERRKNFQKNVKLFLLIKLYTLCHAHSTKTGPILTLKSRRCKRGPEDGG